MTHLEISASALVDIEEPYVLLKPIKSSPPASLGTIHTNETWASVKKAYGGWKGVRLLGYDFETNGEQIWSSSFAVVGLGLAWDGGSCYISLKKEECPNAAASYIRGLINLGIPLVAHNQYFDGTILAKYNGGVFPAVAKWCTYALSKHLATEDFKGQQWGLKHLMKSLLGWPESNEKELYEWLTMHEQVTSVGRKEDSGFFPMPPDEKGERWGRPDKGKMYMAPTDILGKYCMLDSISTLKLYTDVIRPCLDRFPEYEAYYEGPFWRMLKRLSESHLRGISINKRKLSELWCELEEEIYALNNKFLRHPTVAPHVVYFKAFIKQPP